LQAGRTILTHPLQNNSLSLNVHAHDSGYIVVVMSNIDGGGSPLANRIGQTLARVKTRQFIE